MKTISGLLISEILVSIVVALVLGGCGGGGSGEQSGTGGGGSGSGGPPNFSTSVSINETSEATVTLTDTRPNSLDVNDKLTITVASRVWAFTAAEATANFWALDFPNAQLFLNGQQFQGFRLAPAGQFGMNFVDLGPGTYWIGVTAGQTVFSGYSNKTFHELSVPTLPSWSTNGNVPLGTWRQNPGGWESRGFTWPAGDVRAYIETEGTGGSFAIMTLAQFQAFQSRYPITYNNGGYAFTYACGGQSGGPTTEIECELKLPPGDYVMIFINDTQSPQGGAGNIQFYAPA